MFCIPVKYNIRFVSFFHGPWNSHGHLFMHFCVRQTLLVSYCIFLFEPATENFKPAFLLNTSTEN